MADHGHGHPGDPRSQERGHELRDVSTRPILWFCVALVFLIVLGFAVSRGVFGLLESQEEKKDVRPAPLAAERPQTPPAPRLEVDPTTIRKDIQARQSAILNSYGWVNEAGGVVRIPIERAMALTAQRGLPVREGAAVKTETPSRSRTR
ncbi:MAG: hypothetical protein AB1898_25430 [Acidobacteriota bacterium]